MPDPHDIAAATIAAEIEAVRARLAAVVQRHPADPDSAAADPNLSSMWAAVEPETRAVVLFSAAYATRHHPAPADAPDDPDPDSDIHAASFYAAELHSYANESPSDGDRFTGKSWPMPLPGAVGALASSLGFDRDDVDISLRTLVLLIMGDPR